MNQFIENLGKLVPLNELAIAALNSLTTDAQRFEARYDLIREGDQLGPLIVILDGWACRN